MAIERPEIKAVIFDIEIFFFFQSWWCCISSYTRVNVNLTIFFFRFLVRTSYLEIYNEEIKDLLGKDQSQRLEVSD